MYNDYICPDCVRCDVEHDFCTIGRMRYPTDGCFDFVPRNEPDGNNALTKELKAIKEGN